MNNTQQFVDFVSEECKKHGVKFKLKKSSYVKLSGNIKCSGWFDGVKKELVVAGGSTQWLSVLVHEYGHLTQWAENAKVWKEADNISNIDEWLNGKDVPEIKKALAKTRDLELDNEKRSVKLIKEWNLPIDTKEYTQKANAYVQFYNYLYYTRRWCTPTNSPYKNPAIYKKMPTIFKMNYKKLSEKYMKVFVDSGI